MPASFPTLTARLAPRSTSKFNNDFNNTAACGGSGFTIWLFCPSETAALVVCALFGIATLAHFVLAVIHRKKFCFVIILGCGIEAGGYAVRALSTQHQQSIGYYSIWYIVLLVTPLIINAWVYMVLGRLIDYFVPERTIGGVYAKRVALIFVLADIFTFIVQIGGAVMLVAQNNPSLNQTGSDVYMVGMGMQQACLAVFGFLLFRLHRRLRGLGDPRPGHPWLPTVASMYLAVALLSVRTIYKIAEFTGGATGPLVKVEWPWYAFDAAPILLLSFVLAALHPGRILQGPGSEYNKIPKDQRKALVRQYKGEKAAHRKGLDVDGAELGLLPRSSHSSPHPPPPPRLSPAVGYGNTMYSTGQLPGAAYDPV